MKRELFDEILWQLMKQCPSEGRWYAPTCVTPGVTAAWGQICQQPFACLVIQLSVLWDRPVLKKILMLLV